MDHLTFAQLLGNYGEFIGAIAVVATLGYLALQVKHSKASVDANTSALDEARRLALAQTYQARAELRIGQLHLDAESEFVAPILDKLELQDWVSNDEVFATLTSVEQRRVRAWLTASQRLFDNYHYQYQQGFIDHEYWENVIYPGLRAAAWNWRHIPNTGFRPSFKALVDEALSEPLDESLKGKIG
jgi:hypothetical protein